MTTPRLLPFVLCIACNGGLQLAPAETDAAAEETDAVETDVVDSDVDSDSDSDGLADTGDTDDTDVPVDTDDTDVPDDTDITDDTDDTDVPVHTDTDPLDTDDTDPPADVVTSTCPTVSGRPDLIPLLVDTNPGDVFRDTGDTDTDGYTWQTFRGTRLVHDATALAEVELDLGVDLSAIDLADGPLYVRWENIAGCDLSWRAASWYASEQVLEVAWEDDTYLCGITCDAEANVVSAWQLPVGTTSVTFCTSITHAPTCPWDTGS